MNDLWRGRAKLAVNISYLTLDSRAVDQEANLEWQSFDTSELLMQAPPKKQKNATESTRWISAIAQKTPSNGIQCHGNGQDSLHNHSAQGPQPRERFTIKLCKAWAVKKGSRVRFESLAGVGQISKRFCKASSVQALPLGTINFPS